MSTSAKIEALIGEEAYAALIRLYGGRRLYVPVCITPENPIVLVIGWMRAIAFAQTFGGERIEIPMRDSFSACAARHDAIRRMRNNGATVAEICASTGYSARQVRRILASEQETA